MNNHLGYAVVYFYRKDDFGTQLLLQKKDRGWRGIDLWTPFGGRIELGEEPISCVKREVLEELGVTVSDEQLQFVREIETTTNTGDVAPLHVFSAQFIWSPSAIRLSEGCGFAFWYSDELKSVPMQPHEKIVAEEIADLI